MKYNFSEHIDKIYKILFAYNKKILKFPFLSDGMFGEGTEIYINQEIDRILIKKDGLIDLSNIKIKEKNGIFKDISNYTIKAHQSSAPSSNSIWNISNIIERNTNPYFIVRTSHEEGQFIDFIFKENIFCQSITIFGSYYHNMESSLDSLYIYIENKGILNKIDNLGSRENELKNLINLKEQIETINEYILEKEDILSLMLDNNILDFYKKTEDITNITYNTLLTYLFEFYFECLNIFVNFIKKEHFFNKKKLNIALNICKFLACYKGTLSEEKLLIHYCLINSFITSENYKLHIYFIIKFRLNYINIQNKRLIQIAEYAINLNNNGPYLTFSRHGFSTIFKHRNKKKIAKMLLKVIEEIKGENISCGIMYGTLLGAIREKGFINHDDDIDIAIVTNQYNSSSILNRILSFLRSLGYNCWIFNEYNIIALDLMYDDTSIRLEIFPIITEDNKCEIFGPKMEKIKIESRLLDSFSGNATLEGYLFSAPKHPIDILEILYGKTWNIPLP